MIGIYCIENKVNHMKYIGQSINIHKRWQEHKRELNKGTHHNDHLQNAWALYGSKNFLFTVLELCDKESLDTLEKRWVETLNTMDRKCGYNIGTPGNCCMLHRHHTLSSRKKMSEWKKLHTIGKDNGFYGKKHTKSTLDKISKKLKGRFSGANNPMYGKVSPMRGKSMSDESKEKMRKHHADFRGAKHPKAKLSEGDVLLIIDMFMDGKTSKEIAGVFNVSKSCTDAIRGHKNWTYLTVGITFPKHRLAETTISQPYI